jgi:hypothetical protein
LSDFVVAPVGRHVQWNPNPGIGTIDICAMIEQPPHHLEVSFDGSRIQWCLVRPAMDIDLRTVLMQ